MMGVDEDEQNGGSIIYIGARCASVIPENEDQTPQYTPTPKTPFILSLRNNLPRT